jgi:transposase
MSSYTSDLTKAQFEEIKPYLPVKMRTRPRKWTDHQMMNAVLYVLVAGCQWRNLPKDMPPWKSVYRYFREWRDTGVITLILKKSGKKVAYHSGKKTPADEGYSGLAKC